MPRPSVSPLCTWRSGAWYQAMVSSRRTSSWFTLLRWVPGSARLAPRANRLALRAVCSVRKVPFQAEIQAVGQTAGSTDLEHCVFIRTSRRIRSTRKSHPRHLLPLIPAFFRTLYSCECQVYRRVRYLLWVRLAKVQLSGCEAQFGKIRLIATHILMTRVLWYELHLDEE